VKKAEANVLKAQAVLTQKQGTNRRKQDLAGRQVVAEQTAEESLRDEEVAKAELSVAESETDVARARLEDARAQFEYEKTILDHHVLYAPFDAIAVERHKEAGSVIKAGDTIFTLIDPATVWGMAFIDESRSGAIREGQEAEVRLRSLPQQTFKAKVVRIGIESDRVTEERRVYVKCEQCPPMFHLGEQIEVFVTVATLDKALLIPEASVKGYDGRSATVWTVENGRLAQRRVGIGLRTEDSRLEITGGLPEGAKVAIGVPPAARLGRAVRLRAE
jgi:HlyD family secretion protein